MICDVPICVTHQTRDMKDKNCLWANLAFFKKRKKKSKHAACTFGIIHKISKKKNEERNKLAILQKKRNESEIIMAWAK